MITLSIPRDNHTSLGQCHEKDFVADLQIPQKGHITWTPGVSDTSLMEFLVSQSVS